MAQTFLQLTNRLLRAFNEVELTSTTFTSAVGIKARAKDAITDAIRMVNHYEEEWPFNYSAISTTTISGIAEYAHLKDTVDWEKFTISMSDLITNGNFTTDLTGWTDLDTGTGASTWAAGRLRLNGGASGVAASEQSITTIKNQVYRIRTKIYGGTITLKVGTTSGGSEIKSDSLTVTNLNRGDFFDTTFTATSVTTFIGFSNSVNANHEVESVSAKENVTNGTLRYATQEEFYRWFKVQQLQEQSQDSFTLPLWVYSTPDLKFGLFPTPDKEYLIEAPAWVYPADLSASGDTTAIPDKYSHLIITFASYLLYPFKSDIEFTAISRDEARKQLEKMRTQLVNKHTTMAGASYFSNRTTSQRGWDF